MGDAGDDHPSAKSRVLVAGAAIVVSCVLTIHCVVTVLLAAPANPAQLAASDILAAYQRPHFEQNWQLFAPEPISDERLLLVRARLVDGTETDFVDVTTPEIRKSHEMRFFAPKTPRIGLNALQTLLWSDPIADRVRDGLDDVEPTTERAGGTGEPEDPLPYTIYEEAVRGQADAIFERFLCVATDRHVDGDVVAVQARLVINEFPPYSRRFESNDAGDVTVRDFPWMDRC